MTYSQLHQTSSAGVKWTPLPVPCVLGSGTLEHILSCCLKSLGGGCYRWRHDQVLKAVAEVISSAITRTWHHKPGRQIIPFVKAGERPKPQHRAARGLLKTASNWQLLVDLERQLQFPGFITPTTLRPDMVLLSTTSRQVAILEPTVPGEDQMEEATERKRAGYADLVEECRRQGWKTWCLPFEVGCRGFAGRTLCKVLHLLGITGAYRRQAIKRSTEAAEKAEKFRDPKHPVTPETSLMMCLSASGAQNKYKKPVLSEED